MNVESTFKFDKVEFFLHCETCTAPLRMMAEQGLLPSSGLKDPDLNDYTSYATSLYNHDGSTYFTVWCLKCQKCIFSSYPAKVNSLT